MIIVATLIISITSCSSSFTNPRDPDWSIESSPCGTEVRLGRYAREIAYQFPLLPDGTPSVRYAGRRQNIFCSCDTANWMKCIIAVLTPIQENIAEERLNPDDRARLQPFYFLELPDRAGVPPLVYVHPRCQSRVVFAELVILYRSWVPTPSRRQPEPSPWPYLDQMNLPLHPPAIQRVNSAPSTLFHEFKTMNIKQCNDDQGQGECPIKREPFHPHQIVYILKQDEPKVVEGTSVACISAAGLTRLTRFGETRQRGGFEDPLKRIPGLLTISEHFTAYLLLEDLPPCQEPVPISSTGITSTFPSFDNIVYILLLTSLFILVPLISLHVRTSSVEIDLDLLLHEV